MTMLQGVHSSDFRSLASAVKHSVYLEMQSP